MRLVNYLFHNISVFIDAGCNLNYCHGFLFMVLEQVWFKELAKQKDKIIYYIWTPPISFYDCMTMTYLLPTTRDEKTLNMWILIYHIETLWHDAYCM